MVATDHPNYRWYEWATRIQASVQGALAYSENPFEIERCQKLLALAHEILAEYTEADFEQVESFFLSEDKKYVTPNVDVRGVVFDPNGHVLMVREKVDGKWSLPGGWADLGDSPAEAVEREIREEAGYIAKAVRVLGVLDRNPFLKEPNVYCIYKIFMRCDIVEQLPNFENSETDDIGFFAFDKLPELSFGRNTPEQMRLIGQFWHQPNLPTLFN